MNQHNPYAYEAKKRWGNTGAYKQSVERTKHWTKQDFQKVKEEYDAIHTALTQLMDQPVSDVRVQKLVERHFVQIQRFYDCSYDMYIALGEMYVTDKRFTEMYERIRPGLARYLRDAIAFFIKGINH